MLQLHLGGQQTLPTMAESPNSDLPSDLGRARSEDPPHDLVRAKEELQRELKLKNALLESYEAAIEYLQPHPTKLAKVKRSLNIGDARATYRELDGVNDQHRQTLDKISELDLRLKKLENGQQRASHPINPPVRQRRDAVSVNQRRDPRADNTPTTSTELGLSTQPDKSDNPASGSLSGSYTPAYNIEPRAVSMTQGVEKPNSGTARPPPTLAVSAGATTGTQDVQKPATLVPTAPKESKGTVKPAAKLDALSERQARISRITAEVSEAHRKRAMANEQQATAVAKADKDKPSEVVEDPEAKAKRLMLEERMRAIRPYILAELAAADKEAEDKEGRSSDIVATSQIVSDGKEAVDHGARPENPIPSDDTYGS